MQLYPGSSMSHLYALSQAQPQYCSEGGCRWSVTKSSFPGLSGMSFYKLILQPKAVCEPHWHANADELGYCVQGQAIVSLYATGNRRAKFVVSEGEAFFIPSGSLHAIENAGPATLEMILQFSHEEPEDFSLSSAFGMFSGAVLGNTWQVPAGRFANVKRSTQASFITLQEQIPAITSDLHYDTCYRYNLGQASPLVQNGGGAARVARQDVWPILKRQALYSLVLNGTGMREPHWHPETAEMGYVHKGQGRMSIQSPSGSVDTYVMQEGDMYFIPKAYPHHIENLGNAPLNLLIFFDQGMPADIGFTASVKSFPNEMLASTLHAPSDFFTQLPTYYQDLFIVNKMNPVD